MSSVLPAEYSSRKYYVLHHNRALKFLEFPSFEIVGSRIRVSFSMDVIECSCEAYKPIIFLFRLSFSEKFERVESLFRSIKFVE